MEQMGEEMAEKLLELKHITKKFSGVTALSDVSMEIGKGEILTLVGENGAGKSTLIKVITGAHEPTEGEFWFEGNKIEHNTPSLAKQMGIGVIYQELNLMPQLTVVENLFFGKELKKGIVLDNDRMKKQCVELIQDLGISIDPDARVSSLSIAEQQIVEIAKAVSEDIKFLIMDEPTAPLTTNEIEKMFEIIEKLQRKGIAILYISHRLEEVFKIADRVCVLRDGRHIITLPISEVDRESLIKYMVGRELGQTYPKREKEIGEIMFEIRHISNNRVHDCSLKVHRGEIVGLAGLVGAGRTELARAIFGADAIKEGQIYLDGKELFIKNPQDAIRYGIGLITEDRKNQGLLLNKGIDFNTVYASMNKISPWGVINKIKEKELAQDYINAMEIKAWSAKQPTGTLSGGNQQKVVLAKWLATNSRVLIFDEPTRGIDVGAKAEIYQLMRNLADEGKAIIMISSEMPELIGMSDRILVMRDGLIVGELSNEEVTQEQILEFATE